MRTLFISDLHLTEKRPDITRAFFHFIDKECIGSSVPTEALYILGDFFEAWIGDDASNPLIEEVKDQLKQISRADIKLYIMHGNRDFLIGEAFCNEVGATLIEDGCIINLNSEPVILMHGDTLCTQDTDYLAFRQMVRDPNWKQAFLNKPISERLTIAQQLRKKSQDSASDKEEYIMDVDKEEVSREMQSKNCRTLIHGHTHRPSTHNIHEPNSGTRYVLGDWDKYGWMIVADEKGINLSSFPI